MLKRSLILISFLLSLSLQLKFTIKVNRQDGAACFYQSLGLNEKYAFVVSSRNHNNYRVDVMYNDQNQWKEVIAKMADKSVERVNKLADREGTYMFCISNNIDELLTTEVQINSGLELANFNVLPSQNDQQNLHGQLDWLQGQKDKIFEALNRIESVRGSSEQLSSMMGVKYIVFAVLGLVFIIFVNYAFYSQAKKTLKDRKLI